MPRPISDDSGDGATATSSRKVIGQASNQMKREDEIP